MMTPEERTQFNEMKKIVESLVAVENVPFIENINRRAGTGIKGGTSTVATSLTQAINEAGTGSYNVASVPDNKRQIILQDGTIEYIGTYNS